MRESNKSVRYYSKKEEGEGGFARLCTVPLDLSLLSLIGAEKRDISNLGEHPASLEPKKTIIDNCCFTYLVIYLV